MPNPASDVRRFGRYEVLGELGRGTMGVVYSARDPAINRMVAIKTVSLAGQPPEVESEYRERFLREAEAAGRLSHPGILTIFDVGEEPETHTPYIVMEYVKGKSLEHSGKLASRTVVGIVRELAEALDYAHGQGVVHRDLKPSNILLTEEAHAKIADFGVAKLNLSELTVAGQIVGTPAFMSPEQLTGGKVDGRSDLFSLGVILYTLLTGHRPFQGNSVVTVSYKVVHHEPVPAAALNLELPAGLNDVVVRAMAKDPAERYQRGNDMARDLKNILEQPELWDRHKEPGSAPASLLEITERVYAKSASKVEPPTWFASGVKHILKKLAAPMEKHRRVRTLALLSSIVAIGAFGLWQNSHHPLEATPAPPPAASPSASEPVKSNAMAVPRAVAQPQTSHPAKPRSVPLRVSVEPKFEGANLTVWVDDHVVLREKLEVVAKKKFGLFGHARAKQSESVYVTPGEHQLRVNVRSATDRYDQSLSLKDSFTEGHERLLTVTFSHDNEMKISLK